MGSKSKNEICCGDQTVIGQHEKRIRPRNSIVQGRVQRPEIWSREISNRMHGNVTQDVKRRSGKYPGESFSPQPDPCGNDCPDNETVRDVVRVVGICADGGSGNAIQRVVRPTKMVAREYSCNDCRSKRKQVGRHTPEKRPPPGRLALAAKCCSTPETVREKIHYLTATPR